MKLDKIPAIYSLTTVSIFRKYSSLMDLIFSLGEVKFDSLTLLRHPNIQYSKVPKSLLFLNNFGDWLKCRKAMKLHDSQMVWFRHLYILFSRYMFINNLQLVEPEA
jgi:N-acetylglucosaminylphosphatidylinositol deacetylase